MDVTAKTCIEWGDKLWGNRGTLNSFWQELANNFYLERADFTLQRTMGVTFGENLMTSYPLIVRRELQNQLGAMLRPKNQVYAFMETSRMDRVDNAGKRFLQYANEVQRRAMYDRKSGFIRATKEGDGDYATFGQCAIRVDKAEDNATLLYRCYHLRDVVWTENAAGMIDTVHVKIKQRAMDVVKRWPKTCGEKVKNIADKDPYCEIELRHIVFPSSLYETSDISLSKKVRRFKFVSLYVALDGEVILEEVGSRRLLYVIPRWVTVSGSQYAYSAATIVAIPDARLLQALTLTLLEAGEKFTNPPLIAVQEAIRSDVDISAGGITNVDAEYDERLGEVLRPLNQDRGGYPIGERKAAEIQETLKEAFFLNKLQGPPQGGPQKTAFQVGQEVQQYIRDALPLFEPMEQDYNGGLFDQTFELLFYENAFGALQDIPRSVFAGGEVEFRFDSPLTNAIAQAKVGKLAQAKEMLAQVVDVEPGTVTDIDWRTAFRDALDGNQTPANWIRSRKNADQIAQQHAQQQQQQQQLDTMGKSANIVQTLANAGQHINPNTPTPANPTQTGIAA